MKLVPLLLTFTILAALPTRAETPQISKVDGETAIARISQFLKISSVRSTIRYTASVSFDAANQDCEVEVKNLESTQLEFKVGRASLYAVLTQVYMYEDYRLLESPNSVSIINSRNMVTTLKRFSYTRGHGAENSGLIFRLEDRSDSLDARLLIECQVAE